MFADGKHHKAHELDMITPDLECPRRDYCKSCSYDDMGADFENSMVAFGQWEWMYNIIIGVCHALSSEENGNVSIDVFTSSYTGWSPTNILVEDNRLIDFFSDVELQIAINPPVGTLKL